MITGVIGLTESFVQFKNLPIWRLIVLKLRARVGNKTLE